MPKMILKDVRISKYKCYTEEQSINIDEKITTLVGKNESGKSAFLEAVAKNNYFDDDKNFQLDPTNDYPRSELSKFKKSKASQYSTICTYVIPEEILNNIKEDLGINVFNINEFTVKKGYNEKLL